jgi:adenylosuccinate synthase
VKVDIIVGALWGDEGKGKLVGAIGHEYDAVLRVNASTNAGHRVHDARGVHVTRQLPSVFWPERTLLVLAPGALLNLGALADEVAARPDLDALRGRLRVASSIALVLRPYVEKGQTGMSQVIGSTHQGTGPSAVARAARHALRLHDVEAVVRAAPNAAEEALLLLARTCAETSPARFASDDPATLAYCADVLRGLVEAFARLEALVGRFCVDYTALLHDELRGRALIEGCNGLLLDNLHGALPHVTSASTNLGAMLSGANLPPACVERAIVVAAAYATCLGKRPFPTELTDDEAAPMRARCDEVDVAEGQPRRLGWLDLPALRKALVGCAGALLHVNKLDALSGVERLRVCVRYRVGDRALEVMPDDPRLVRRAAPEYLELEGWREPLSGARRLADLPPAARRYVEALQGLLPNRIASLGVGPRSEDLVPL